MMQRQWRGGWRFWAGIALAVLIAAPAALAEIPDYEFREVPKNPADAATPRPKYRFLFGPAVRWSGPIRWKYNHANAPEPFASDRAGTIAKIRAAFEVWQPACGVQHVYEGETTVAPNTTTTDPGVGTQPDGQNVVGWAELDGNASGVAYPWFESVGTRRELVDTDIALSVSRIPDDIELKRTTSHEWGHAMGLAHSDINGMLMSGPPDSAYSSVLDVRYDDQRGCRCLYGPGTTPAGFACSLPASVDMGRVALRTPSSPIAVNLTNSGNAPLTVTNVLATSGLDLIRTGPCVQGAVLAPGQTCTVELAVAPRVPGVSSVDAQFFTSDGLYRVTVHYDADPDYVPPPTTTVDVVEYYNGAFDHYFVTYLSDEIRKLDDGTFVGWTRTGRKLKAWTQPMPGSVPVCRFFSAAFTPKSSHFYTPFASECQSVKASAAWTFEGEVFYVALPDGAGACAAGTVPVYRAYNQGLGGAPNHRFTTDAAVLAQMILQGWMPEGTGLGVGMCSPA
jgi:hypothetical protein